MSQSPSQLGSASWSAHDTYTPPAMSQDYYAESGETVIGGPSETTTETTPDQDQNQNVVTPPTSAPEITTPSTPDTVEPTPAPDSGTGDSGTGGSEENPGGSEGDGGTGETPGNADAAE